jgi:TrmH family RNA methyltransferase
LTYESITSTNNPRVKHAASLREARWRKREQRILIDGSTLIHRALDGGVECETLFVSEGAMRDIDHSTEGQGLRSLMERLPVSCVCLLGSAAMKKLQYGERDEDAIAVAITPEIALSERMAHPSSTARSLYLVLDRIEKPGNLGAMLRSADAAGVTAVLVSDPVSEIWNPNAIRSSLGAVFRVPLAVGTAQQVETWLRERDVAIFAARAEGGRDYSTVRYPQRAALVVGNEALGLQSRWMSADVTAIHIPMHGMIDSLNASVTGAILLFEVVRQAGHP